MITQSELLKKVGASYTMFVQLQIDQDKLAIIDSCNSSVSRELILELLVDGSSWREQLLALFFICKRDIKTFYGFLFQGLANTRTISIVPICAVIALCVNEANCLYDLSLVSHFDRNCADGAIGYALDKVAYHTSFSEHNIIGCDPNHGQNFEDFYEFYKSLYKANRINKATE